MSLSTDLTNSINAIKADGEKLHAIVHGTATDVIATDGGNVNSLAKTIRDLFADAETIFDDMRSAVTDANPWGSVDGKSWDTVTWAGNKPATLAHSTATDSGEDAMMTVAIPADTARVRFRADIAGAYNWGGNGGMAPHLVLLDSEFNIILKSTPSVEYWTNGCQLLPGLRLDTSVACPAGTRYLAIYFDTGADGHGSYSGTMTYSVALTNMHVTTSTSVTIETLTSRAQDAQTAKTLTEGYRDAAWVAKLSAESSSAGANAAKLSAQEHRDAALTAKNAADTHASNAGIAAGAAQTSADNASGHATSAQTSAGNAQTYEGNAYTSSVNAAGYEGNASTSKTNAASYEAAAYTAMVNAGNSNKVATDDRRLGLRGGVWTTVSSSSVSGGLRPVTPVAGWACLSLNWLSRNHVAQTTVQSVTGAEFIAGVQFGFYAQITTAGVLSMYYNTGAGNVYDGVHVPPAGWQWLHLLWDAATRTFSFFYDGETVAAATVSIPGTLPCGPLLNVMAGWTASSSAYAALGHARSALVLNFIPSDAQRRALMRGEYPQAWVGGVSSYAHVGAWTETNNPVAAGVTINTNAGGVLDVASVAAAGYYFQFASGAASTAPLLQQGRVLRLRYSLTVASGSVRILPYNAATGEGYRTGLMTLAAGTDMVVDLPVDVARTGGGGIGLKLTFDSAVFVLSDVSIEILGAQILVGPSDWTRTRGVDMSGNCNDLIYGAGVVAIEPAATARVIAAKAAGATLSAGAVGSIGAISGATYPDAKAIAALRAWDAVTAHPAQSIPFQSTGLFVEVAANGTPTVKSGALGTNSTFAANYALKLVHNIQ